MGQRLRLSDWDATVYELRRFGAGGEVSVCEDGIRIDFGSAKIDVRQDGRIRTGMALHDFERDGESELFVDHDAGTLTVESGAGTYTFRRPRG